ncbi:hypothetical protein, partial [Sinorhizobium meliloti]|uniref:hypothetical protein n=1 Tax=Rhizobium meliloti TaxID=382 RepID=UPI001AECCD3F
TMIGKLNLPAHLQPGSTPTILVANPVKSFATEPFGVPSSGPRLPFSWRNRILLQIVQPPEDQ